MKIPALVFILLFNSFLALAQVERKPSPAKQSDSVETKMNRSDRRDLIKDLDLTREQKMKLKEIRQSNKTKKEAIENNSQLSDREKKDQLRSLQKEQAQNIQAILTDEQKAKFLKNRQAIKEQRN